MDNHLGLFILREEAAQVPFLKKAEQKAQLG